MPPLVLWYAIMNSHTQSLIFSASQVAKITNLWPAQVAQIGQFIVPYLPANGKGYRIGYSFRNIVEVVIVSHLIKFGVPRKRIQKYLSDLVGSRFGWLEENGHSGWIVLDDQWRWSAGPTPNEALETLAHSGFIHAAITIDVGLIKQEIQQKIIELGGWNGNAGVADSVAEGSIAVL